jgi:hypothetical protein
MTKAAIHGIGYCARMTLTGDWAFNYALDLTLHHDVRLNIFFFPTPPSQPHAPRGRRGERIVLPEERRNQIERDVRLYYDQMLGEYVNVGFRLCDGDEDPELRRCLLIKREYDLLILPYEGYRCRFGERSIEEFAESMPCPTVLVGPEQPTQLFVNSPAGIVEDYLLLEGKQVRRLNDPSLLIPFPG